MHVHSDGCNRLILACKDTCAVHFAASGKIIKDNLLIKVILLCELAKRDHESPTVHTA